MEVGLFFQVTSDRMISLKLYQGGSRWILEKLSRKSGDTVQQAAQEGGGVTALEVFEKTCGCGTEGNGLVDMVEMG